MLDRPLPQRGRPARRMRLLFVGELHGDSIAAATPAAWISGTHLSTSELTRPAERLRRALIRRRQVGAELGQALDDRLIAHGLLTAALIRATIGAGVPLGMNKAVQAKVCRPGRPASFADGTFGIGRRALRDGHHDRRFPARGHMRRRGDDLIEQRIDLAAEQVVVGFRQAAIGNMLDHRRRSGD